MLSHLNCRRVRNGEREGFAQYSNNRGGTFTSFTTLRQQHHDSTATEAVATLRTGNFTSYRQSNGSYDDDDNDDVLEVFSTASSDDNNSNEMPTAHDAAPTPPEDDSRPPTPWKNSTAKQIIIKELKDQTSDIHLQIGEHTEDNFDQVNFKSIHSSYAKRYKLSNFRENFKRILRHKLNNSGPFKVEQETIEPWTSREKRSKAWHLLYELRMADESNDELNRMTAEEIWQSNELFKQYSLQNFKKYNNDMAKSTDKQRKDIKKEEEDFKQHCINIPHNEMTDRGEPFWYNHPAKSLLKEDVESGLAYDIKPAALRETREEYKQFKLKTFRKHIYQEQERQRAAPYWRHKRNIAARQIIERERAEMRRQWTVERMFGSIQL